MANFRLLFLCVASSILLTAPALASVSGYINIPDIDGESRAADHEGEIDFHSISWGSARDLPPVGSGGSVDVSLKRGHPALAEAAAEGKAFDEVVIHLRKDSGDEHLDYLVITLTNCTISSYNRATDTRAEAAGDAPAEEITLNYEKIKYEY